MSDSKHIYAQAIELWGVDKQLDMVIEEASELIICILKVKRGRIKIDCADMLGEIADLSNMLDQLKFMINNDEQIENIKQQKLFRLESRIKANTFNG